MLKLWDRQGFEQKDTERPDVILKLHQMQLQGFLDITL
jgi:hypothetical protein